MARKGLKFKILHQRDLQISSFYTDLNYTPLASTELLALHFKVITKLMIQRHMCGPQTPTLAGFGGRVLTAQCGEMTDHIQLLEKQSSAIQKSPIRFRTFINCDERSFSQGGTVH